MHIALYAENIRGYVAMAFAEKVDVMDPADSVIGWWDDDADKGVVLPVYLKGSDDSLVFQDDTVKLSNTGVVQYTNRSLVVCFTRNLEQRGKAGLKPLDLFEDGGIPLNFAASREDGLKAVHIHNGYYECGRQISLGLGTVSEEGEAEEGPSKALLAHGILMALAWALFAPLGVLAARNKHVVKSCAEAVRVRDPHAAWFMWHRIAQGLAACLTAAGFGIAVNQFDIGDDLKIEGVTVLKAHYGCGIAVMALVGLQVLAAIPRPHPGDKWRPLWALFHANTGRITLALAIATLYLGINLWEEAARGNSATPWYAAVSAALGFWLLLALVLALYKPPETASAPSIKGSPSPTSMQMAFAADKRDVGPAV